MTRGELAVELRRRIKNDFGHEPETTDVFEIVDQIPFDPEIHRNLKFVISACAFAYVAGHKRGYEVDRRDDNDE